MAKSKYLSNEIFTVFICGVVIVLGYIALAIDFSFFSIGNVKKHNQAIGKVATVNSDVRLLAIKNVFWTEAKKNDAISFGDSIFVGSNSNTVVKFADGKSITLGENSLVKFFKQEKTIKLSLQYGSIKSSNLPQNILLDDCGEIITIEASENSDLEIGKQDCGKIKVQSTLGQVKINNAPLAKNTKPIAIKPAAQVVATKLKEKPAVNPAMVQIESLNPAEAAKLASLSLDELKAKFVPLPKTQLVPPVLVREQTTIVLSDKILPTAAWFPTENANEYLIESADNPEFSNVQTLKTSATTQVFSAVSNKIYYRLKSLKAGDSSEYSKVGVIEVTYPGIKLKQEMINVSYLAKNSKDLAKTKNLAVSWSAVANAATYIVEVDSHSSFKQPLKFSAKNPAHTISIPKEGKYFYRVNAYDAKNQLISTTPKVGEINYTRIFDMVTPIIDEDYTNLTYFFQKTGKFIILKWNVTNVKTAHTFKIEISKQANFSKILHSFTTQDTTYTIDGALPVGRYYWRVRTESSSSESDWSKYGLIEIIPGKI